MAMATWLRGGDGQFRFTRRGREYGEAAMTSAARRLGCDLTGGVRIESTSSDGSWTIYSAAVGRHLGPGRGYADCREVSVKVHRPASGW